jgi:anti-sigma factor RsiW
MLRERLDEYLDGGLDPAGRREVEAMLASDPAAARMLAQMKAQRALRSAVYDSYLPTKAEAQALADRVLTAAVEAPVGRVGYWLRRGAGVAAAVAVVIGTFAMGRVTAPVREVKVVETRTEYEVTVLDAGGVQQVRRFTSLDDHDKFIQQFDQQGVTGVALTDVMTPGHL